MSAAGEKPIVGARRLSGPPSHPVNGRRWVDLRRSGWGRSTL